MAKNHSQAGSSVRPLMILLVTILLLSVLYYLAVRTGWIEMMTNPAQLLTMLQSDNQGWTGIAIIVGLMAMAIVFNPIPSAPVALVAGAIYGHTWGTVYIVIGALIGAIIAFSFRAWPVEKSYVVGWESIVFLPGLAHRIR